MYHFYWFFQCFGFPVCALIVFSNVSVFWKPKTLEKPIKTIIFKLSPDGGVAPGDNLKIMVFMVFIVFFPMFWAPCASFLFVFSNVSVFWKPKTLEKPIKTIKTIIFKLSPDGGVAPGDNLKIMVFMVFIVFFQCFGLLVRHIYWFFQCFELFVRNFYCFFQCFGLLVRHFYWFFQCFRVLEAENIGKTN